MARLTKVTKNTKRGTKTRIIDTGKMTGSQALKAKRLEEKSRQIANRTTEAEKTARTKARAAAIASATTASVDSRERQSTERAKYQTQALTAQYAALINGNQGNRNEANPDDTTGRSDKSWGAIPIN